MICLFLNYLIINYLLHSGLGCASWYSSMFFSFNYLNHKKKHLLLLWLQMTNELPDNKNYELKGLSSSENDKFWIKEDKFNYYYDLLLKVIVITLLIIFTIPLFYTNYGVDEPIYSILLIAHTFHHFLFLFVYFHATATPNLFLLTILKFFSTKFNNIIKEINKLRFESVKIDNKKLGKLINDYNCVHLEMININNYFKYLIGVNFFHYSILCIIASFLSFNVDILMKTTLFAILIFTYSMNLFLPFKFSQIVSLKVSF